MTDMTNAELADALELRATREHNHTARALRALAEILTDRDGTCPELDPKAVRARHAEHHKSCNQARKHPAKETSETAK